jgi:hypothetical protein
MATENPTINYFARDFNSLKGALINYAQTYFPNTYNDFTPASTGMLFMNMAAYVGDVLSFYLDNQIQETFIQSAKQTENIFALAQLLGYTPAVASSATANVDIYQQVPAIIIGGVAIPDYSYATVIPANTSLSTSDNNPTTFSVGSKVDFSFSSSLDPTEVSVYQLSGNTPTYFLLKKTRRVSEGTTITKTFPFASPIEFQTVTIQDTNIVQLISCVDSEGNNWYEVPNLAQESIYDSISNTNTNDPNFYSDAGTLNLLRLKKVERRFAKRFVNYNTLEIQFGNGGVENTTETIIPNPDNVGLGLPYELSKLTTAFSPTNFIFSNTYGIAPANTTLTFQYLKSSGAVGNVRANSINVIPKSNIVFKTIGDPTISNYVINSITCNNPEAASGGGNGDTLINIKQNSLGNFQTQLRTVTSDDYLVRAYSLPSQFGSVSKAFVTPEKVTNLQPGEVQSSLNLYVLGKNINGTLAPLTTTVKQNLKTYLSQYRMINDSIKIKDAFIINIGVNFDIVLRPQYTTAVLATCTQTISDFFSTSKYQINQPLILTDLYSALDKIEGVQTVKNIEITNLTSPDGSIYSQYAYDVAGATINRIVYPSVDPMIFELKYPGIDIKGRVVPF